MYPDESETWFFVVVWIYFTSICIAWSVVCIVVLHVTDALLLLAAFYMFFGLWLYTTYALVWLCRNETPRCLVRIDLDEFDLLL